MDAFSVNLVDAGHELMDRIQPGDVIVVQYLDRFARTVLEGLQVVEDLANQGIYIKCLNDPIDTSDGSAAAKAQLQMSVVFSESQRNTTRERIVAGQNKARAAGRTPGRKSALSPSQQHAVHQQHLDGTDKAELAREWKVSRSTIDKAIAEAGNRKDAL